MELLETERDILLREESIGIGHAERAGQIAKVWGACSIQLKAHQARWEAEQDALVEKVFVLRRKLNPNAAFGSLSPLPHLQEPLARDTAFRSGQPLVKSSGR